MYSRLDAASNGHCIDVGSYDTFDDTVLSILENCEEKSMLVGYSMGARIALGAALANPHRVSGLVLISAHAGLEESQKLERKRKDEELAEIAENDVKKMFEILDQKSVFDTHDGEVETSRIRDGNVLVKQLRVLGLGSYPFTPDDLMQLRMPVLYVSGSRDKKYTDLNASYKKKTPFAHHRVLDSDHRVPFVAPNTLSLLIEWFDAQVLNG